MYVFDVILTNVSVYSDKPEQWVKRTMILSVFSKTAKTEQEAIAQAIEKGNIACYPDTRFFKVLREYGSLTIQNCLHSKDTKDVET